MTEYFIGKHKESTYLDLGLSRFTYKCAICLFGLVQLNESLCSPNVHLLDIKNKYQSIGNIFDDVMHF